MKNLLKSLIRRFAAFFYKHLHSLVEEERLKWGKLDLEKSIENVGEGLAIKDLPEISMPRMLSLGRGVRMGKRISIESEAGVIIGDGAQIEDGVVIETIDKSKDIPSNDLAHPDFMKPVMIGAGAYIGKNAVIRPGAILEKGSMVESGTIVGANESFPKRKMPQKSPSTKWKRGKDWGGNIFFVLSTGRSGTKTIAEVLSRHPEISCKHEAQYFLNVTSTMKVEGEANSVSKLIEGLYGQCTNILANGPIYGESDLKNSPLVGELHEVMPEAKFIWLIRRAEDFVASAYGRGWFDEREHSFEEEKKFSPDAMISEADMNPWRWEYARHRVNGGKTLALSREEWRQMTAFERNCWYWSFWNGMIEDQLSKLPKEQHFFLRLEEMDARLPAMLKWLGAGEAGLKTGVYNQANHKKLKKQAWTEEQMAIFDKWCQEGMKKWYGND